MEGCQGSPDVTVPPGSESSSVIPPVHQRFFDYPYTLAILPFENLSRHAHLNWLCRALQQMLVSDLAKWPQLEVVSRDALGPVLREQWLQQRGFSSASNPVSLGQLKGVRYLIQGRIYAQQDALAVDLQVVDVETGVVVGSVEAHGLESEIPRLEQDLVTRTMRLFDPSLSVKTGATLGEVEKKLSRPHNRHERVEKERGNALPPGQFHSHSVHQIDALLSLENLTHQRRESFRLAETIWNEGWSFEMGEPFYNVWQYSNQTTRSVPILTLPISVFFPSNRLADVFEKVRNGGIGPGVFFDSDGFRMTTDEGSGANQLFIEHFHKPRRVFVRALDDQGHVLAVFSDWEWRTETRIQIPDPQWITFPMWPKPFVTGLAQFPVDWVEREGHHVTFEVVVVPVPDEKIGVIVEPLQESANDKKVVSAPAHLEESLLQTVEQLIRSHWKPAITEGLPLRGYLPGNKRTAMGVVHIQEGNIVQIQFQNLPDEPGFIKSLKDLQSNLLGSCVDCQDSNLVVPLSAQFSKIFRLQLTLVKDIHALQLGSQSH